MDTLVTFTHNSTGEKRLLRTVVQQNKECVVNGDLYKAHSYLPEFSACDVTPDRHVCLYLLTIEAVYDFY